MRELRCEQFRQARRARNTSKDLGDPPRRSRCSRAWGVPSRVRGGLAYPREPDWSTVLDDTLVKVVEDFNSEPSAASAPRGDCLAPSSSSPMPTSALGVAGRRSCPPDADVPKRGPDRVRHFVRFRVFGCSIDCWEPNGDVAKVGSPDLDGPGTAGRHAVGLSQPLSRIGHVRWRSGGVAIYPDAGEAPLGR
jgi:hypothetical protein